MGIAAYEHTKNTDIGEKMLAASPWWALYPRIYDELGRSICDWGRKIIIVDLVALLIWYLSANNSL